MASKTVRPQAMPAVVPASLGGVCAGRIRERERENIDQLGSSIKLATETDMSRIHLPQTVICLNGSVGFARQDVAPHFGIRVKRLWIMDLKRRPGYPCLAGARTTPSGKSNLIGGIFRISWVRLRCHPRRLCRAWPRGLWSGSMARSSTQDPSEVAEVLPRSKSVTRWA